MITYEHPLSERIRTLLRLENLFKRVQYFAVATGTHDHHFALVTLLEILEVASRTDLKLDIAQELERQRQLLRTLRDNSEISQQALNGTLDKIERSADQLLTMRGRAGNHLRDNEWLMGIKNRISLPGGSCEFDLPSYHFWLNRDPSDRQQDIHGWLEPFMPIHDASMIMLNMLRSSGQTEQHTARHGAFQKTLSRRSASLLRLSISCEYAVVPEISANRYALNIHFTLPDTDTRPRQTDTDIEFEIAFCNL